MGKAPAFQYYAKDHIASKASLTITERGAWSTLVDHCWENGAPISMAVAVRLVGSELLESIRFLLRIEDDTVTFDWIEETRAMQLEKSRKNSENGKLGGRGKSRASKPKSERKANALRNENETKPFRAANAVEVEDIQKRKEPASEKPELVWPAFAGEKVKAKWAEFIAYRIREKKQRYQSVQTEQKALDLVAKYFPSGPDLVAALDHTMARTWVFPVDPTEHKYPHLEKAVPSNGVPAHLKDPNRKPVAGWQPLT